MQVFNKSEFHGLRLDLDENNFDMSSVDYDEDVFFNSLSEKLYGYAQVLFLEWKYNISFVVRK